MAPHLSSRNHLNQLIFDSTLTCGDYFADRLAPTSIPATLETNLLYAKEAIAYTLNALTFGACNVKDAKISCAVIRSMQEQFLGSVKMLSDPEEMIELSASIAERFKMGNCFEHSMVALRYLKKIKGFSKVEAVYIDNNDHAFLVIGRNGGSPISEVQSWGPSAVICDPWGRRCFPAVDLEYRITDLLAARMAYYKPFELRTQSIELLRYNYPFSLKNILRKPEEPYLPAEVRALMSIKLKAYKSLQHRAEIHTRIQKCSESLSITSLSAGMEFLTRRSLGENAAAVMGALVAVSVALYCARCFFKQQANTYLEEAYRPWQEDAALPSSKEDTLLAGEVGALTSSSLHVSKSIAHFFAKAKSSFSSKSQFDIPA